MRRGWWTGVACMLSAAAAAKSAPKAPAPDPVPKVLPVDAALPRAFLDVGLEGRCEALKTFVARFAQQYFPPGMYQEGACGEGNGLGGARYDLDFKLVPPQRAPLAYRFDLAFAGTPRVRLCDADPLPMSCSTNRPIKPLVFEAGARFALTERAHQAALAFYAIHPNAMHLLPTVAAWVEAKSTRHQIYGMNYEDFVRGLAAERTSLPLAAGAPPVQVTLKPSDPAHPEAGRAAFAGTPPPALMACFKCGDLDCLNDSVRYRFDDRFLALSRPAAEKGAVAPGAGWVIEGPKPMGPEHPWSFACGVSRYSLESRRR